MSQIAFSADGSLLTSSDQAGVVKLWDFPRRTGWSGPCPGPGTVARIAFSRDGRLLAAGGIDGVIPSINHPDVSIRVWDVATGLAAQPPCRSRRGPSLAWRSARTGLASCPAQARARPGSGTWWAGD